MIICYTIPEIWHMTDVIIILGHSLPFYPHTSPKNQNLKKIKKTTGDIITLHKCPTNHYPYATLFLRYDVWKMYLLFFILGYFFPFYHPNSPKNQNFKKMKKCQEISSFYMCVPKILIRWCMVPEIWCKTDRQTDGWTDRQKKWHEDVGAPPKNW